VNESKPGAQQPLDDIRLVEIGTSVAAPYASWILAALGADVIKVESPNRGDDTRHWGRPFGDGISSYFHALNQDKRGITVDFKDEAERSWLREFLIAETDVVIQNLRPGRIEAYGLGATGLIEDNPRLIYCNLGAFGHRGPMKDLPGYDLLMQAYGGLMSTTGEEGRPPVRVGTSIIDMGTGLWCAVGILAALKRRAETGQGCVVDASLYETALAWMANPAAAVQIDGRNPRRLGSGVNGMAPYQAYRCSDGYLVVAAANDNLFERLCGVLGHPEWTGDRRFATNPKRCDNREALNALIEPIFSPQPRQVWRHRLDQAGVPNAPVQNTLEMIADAQMEALGMLRGLTGDGPRLMGIPLSFDGQRPPLRRLAPSLGEHNKDIKKGGD